MLVTKKAPGLRQFPYFDHTLEKFISREINVIDVQVDSKSSHFA